MSVWRQITRGLRTLTHRKDADQDVADEVQDYFEQTVAAYREQGLSEEEARRAARLELNSTQAREQVRSHGWENMLETFFLDLRYAGRQLRTNPGFSIVAILTLALGIGATTAIFSAVNPILFESLPYPQAKRLTMVWEKRNDGLPRGMTFATFLGLSEQDRSFEALAVMKPWQPTMLGWDQPERLEGQRVSANYFRVLGVPPVLGRDFQASDDRFRGPNVVILSDGLWRQRFRGDPSIVGQQVELDETLYTVIGVMPSGFENVLAPATRLWAPLQYDSSLPANSNVWGHHLRMIGRLKAGVSRNEARNELDVILKAVAQRYAKGFDESGGASGGMLVNALQDDVTRIVRPALLAVLGAVMLVLIIACVNVTNLLLARGAQRRGEFAMRAALGAARTRLVRQLLTESLLVAVLGGALGMIVARFGVQALVALSPSELPRVNVIRLDGAVFAFGLVITTVIGILVGLIPALQASSCDLHSGIQQRSSRAAGSRQRTRRTLVVAEVALALVLLVSAGLLLRTLRHLFAVNPGFDAAHVLTMQVQEAGKRFRSDEVRFQFFERALEAVRQVPGVVWAGFTGQLPLSGDYDVYGIEFEKDHNPMGGPALRYAVTPGYLETMRIALRRGRLLNDHDTRNVPAVVLINESFAKRKFGGEDPIGQRIRIGPNMGQVDKPWATIVGVVGDVKQESLAVGEEDAFYLPTVQWAWGDDVLSLVVRTEGDAAAMAGAIRKAIWSVDKDQPIVRVATMEAMVARSEAQRHFALVLFECFAVVALLLAAIGIFGVLSGSVTERMREIGVRCALGASRGDILSMILGQGITLTSIGVVIGLAGALAASQVIASMLFGVSRLDPVTYAGVILLLAGVSVVACWVPAWRAARVDPMITLRAE